jgi:hypothetical protein|uniref:Uncharacterized protein n=1 Tax=Picea glauca TaxID=3330 RepID=A0A101M4I0_PICGL|nr:hypothetical protein ABT39_MTgene556 [Picea glauca]QHR89388.1 hypothetical protein Q903MT_gene3409 [Picea sitchensis]
MDKRVLQDRRYDIKSVPRWRAWNQQTRFVAGSEREEIVLVGEPGP